MLELRPSVGILNLHTGLSPYIKGGPNCTNWCIATGQFHLVGNTVMWIDEGIDSGNIFATEFTDFTGTDDLNAIHVKVMDHAHDLVVRSLESISKGSRTSVKQSEIAKGVTYYTRDWNLKQKFSLVSNIDAFNRCVLSGECLELRKDVRTVPVA
jgi:methionyl-tRNA formyltransferase